MGSRRCESLMLQTDITDLTLTTWEPEARDCRMVAVVADPEEKARAYLACSSAATASSKLVRLGLELRIYSYAPTGLPTEVCANVVESDS